MRPRKPLREGTPQGRTNQLGRGHAFGSGQLLEHLGFILLSADRLSRSLFSRATVMSFITMRLYVRQGVHVGIANSPPDSMVWIWQKRGGNLLELELKLKELSALITKAITLFHERGKDWL
jgi:hypothetical protein